MFLKKLLISFIIFTISLTAYAAEYKFLVPFAAGGQSDIAARAIAKSFEKLTGDTMVVENHPGADGYIGVSKFKLDKQYDVIGLGFSIVVLNPAIKKDVPYTDSDFEHIIYVGTSPNVLITNTSGSFHNLKADIKTNSAMVGGNSTIAEVNLDIISNELNSGITYVPYKGSPDVVVGVLNGSIKYGYLAPTAAMLELHKTNKLKIIGSSSNKTIFFDNIQLKPIASELGVSSQFGGYSSLAIRPDVPQDKKDKLKKYLWLAVQDAETQDKLKSVFLLDDSHTDMVKFRKNNAAMQVLIKSKVN